MEASHHLIAVIVLLVRVEFRVEHVCGTGNLRVRVGPTLRVLLLRFLLEVGLSRVEVQLQLMPAGVELACGKKKTWG